MKAAKRYLLLFATLFFVSQLYAQKDSIHALFKPVKLDIHYSNLQWEGGYNGFVFNHAYLSGFSLDLFGIVFNEVNFAFGIDEAGSGGGYGRGIPVINYNVQSYSDLYLKIEPMLFPDRILNLSMPVKFARSTDTYPDTSTVLAAMGRRGRRSSVSYFSITPGVFCYVNVFPGLNLGAGASYRVALTTSNTGSPEDYSNFEFSLLLRIRVAMRNKTKVKPPKNDYYNPETRFQ
jgi:hypothetical protein